MKVKFNEIYNMHCFDGMKLLDNNSVDLTVTSPPYGVAKEYETNNPKDQLNDLLELLENTFAQLARITKQEVIYL